MGRINNIWPPQFWKKIIVGESKLVKDDIIYKMEISDGDDYISYSLIEFISKDNYERIISGEYIVKYYPYSELTILLFDENKKLIPLVKGNEKSFDKLSDFQKEEAEIEYQHYMNKNNISKKEDLIENVKIKKFYNLKRNLY